MAAVGVITVTSAQIQKFTDDYKLEAQQVESRVAGTVYNKTFNGEVYNDTYKNLIATSEVIKNRETGAATVIKDTAFTTRRLLCDTYTYPTMLADKDVAEMMKNPKGEVVQTMIAMMNRNKDTVTTTAMVGNASEKNNATGVFADVALPAGQIITEAAAVRLTVAKLRQTKVLLDKAEQPKEGRCIALSSTNLDSLLAETEVTSSDYNVVKTLVQGEIDTFLGFKFIQTEVFGDTYAIAYQKMGVLFGQNMGRQIKIKEDTSRYCDWLIQVEEQFGALRREDTAVVQIETGTQV